MPTRAGGSFRRGTGSAQEWAAEFRAQALAMQIDRLSSDLTRLRAAIRDHLSHPESHTLARLRFLLGHADEKAA